LVRDPFDNLAALRRYPGPVLILHGRHDPVIPFAHGEALARAATRATLVEYPCGHNDCPPDPQRFWRDIAAFLTAAGISADPPPKPRNGLRAADGAAGTGRQPLEHP
jgi:hypothetical protein